MGAALTDARGGLPVGLGEVASIEPQLVHSGGAAAPYTCLANTRLGTVSANLPPKENLVGIVIAFRAGARGLGTTDDAPDLL